MGLEEVIIVALGAWRITAMISYEDGPLRIFRRLREAMGVQHNDAGEPVMWPSGLITDMISCPWCLGGYSVAAAWGLWQISEAAVIVFAAWTILIAIERWNHGK